ncbi:MAG: hypothetical protein KGI67_03240 [Pseudomonadota bacterium]|nr:hypothetical protein [Pseudomonadota bacterium]
MSLLRSDSDEPFFRYLRLAILALLGLAVLAMLMSLVLGASRYLRIPDGTVHARKAPKAEAVSTDELLEKLNAVPTPPAAGEPATGATAAPGKPKDSEAGSRRYADEVQAMVKCAHAFALKNGNDEAEPDPAATEDFRAQFEKVAAASPDRGDPWAGDVSRFVCSLLEDKDAGALAKAGKLNQPLVTAVNFHIAQWDAARRKVHEFEAQEKRRVEAETVNESHRVAAAWAAAGAAVNAAAVCFGLVLALAACLVLAGIEANLRGIRNSLEDLVGREPDAGPLPVMDEEVAAPAAAHSIAPTVMPATVSATAPTLRALDDALLDDPLEVEYQIPEEAISRG